MLANRLAIKVTLQRALFEFLVIVMGITVAFLVDEWRQERQEQDLIDQYLVRLSSEAKNNLWSTRNVRDRFLASKMDALGEVITYARQPDTQEVDLPTLITALNRTNRDVIPWFVKYQYNAFINTGSQRLLNDPELMQVLSSTYEADRVLFSQIEEIRGPYQRFISQLIPAEYQSTNNRLAIYVGNDISAPVINDNEQEQELLNKLNHHKPELLRLARLESDVATATWYALTRIEQQLELVITHLEERGYDGEGVL